MDKSEYQKRVDELLEKRQGLINKLQTKKTNTMKKRKVISNKNLPARLPIWATVILYLVLDYYNASQVVYGVVITLVILWWILAIAAMASQKPTNIFPESNDGQKPDKV